MKKTTLHAYGFLGLPLGGLLIITQIFIPNFYITNIGLSLSVVGFIFFITRFLDVLTDPIMGYISDKTKLNRSFFIVAGIPLLAFCSYGLLVPFDNSAMMFGFMLCGFYIGWTIIMIPYSAMGAELSSDYHERSLITAHRETYALLGTLAALLLIAFSSNPNHKIAYAGIFLLCVSSLIILFCIKEKKRKKSATVFERKQILALLKNKSFCILISSYLFNGMANALPALLFMLFANIVLNQTEQQAGLLLFTYLLFAVIFMPFWMFLSRKTSKEKSWQIAMSIAIICFAFVPFCTAENIWLFYMITIITGACLGADLSLPPSMQADVIDIDKKITGQNRSALFFSLWTMTTKIAIAICAGLFLPLIEIFGFSAETKENIAILVLFYCLVPVGLKAIAIILMQKYRIQATH